MDKNIPYVSRAGLKLASALEEFSINPRDLICADFGVSTGGFTDCLLQNGAQKIYAVDTAYGELAWKLRNDPRVVVMERTNALHVLLSEQVDLCVVDVGWTKLEKIIPNILKNLKQRGLIIALLKPQYEVDKKHLIKGSVSEDYLEEFIPIYIAQLSEILQKDNRNIVQYIISPILGDKGHNREFLLLIK